MADGRVRALTMTRKGFIPRTRKHKCADCGIEIEHTVREYRFDVSNRALGSREDNGPITLVIDEYGDRRFEIDDGYKKAHHYWDQDNEDIVIEIVARGDKYAH